MIELITTAMLLVGSFARTAGQEAPATRPGGDRTPVGREDFSDVTPVAVIDVLSGELIVVETRKGRFEIRCHGVQVRRDEAAGAATAREFLANLLRGEEVFLKYERPAHADEDPRRAYVFRAPDGLFVNSELVRQGYAAVDGTVETRYRERLEECERRARAATKGIWSMLREAPVPVSQPAASKPAPPPSPSPEVAASQPVGKPPPSHGSVGLTVYVTRSGAKYHRANCSFVRKGATAISVQEALDKGLTPCTRCKP